MIYDDKDFSKPIPGDVFFTLTHGPGRYTIPMGQALIGDGSVWEHTGICVDDGIAFEARPPRARMFAIENDDQMLWYRLPLMNHQRDYIRVSSQSDFKAGWIKYGWASYLNMAMLRIGIRPKWLKDLVAYSPRRICSQLVDEYLTDSGFNVLDGVLPGEVSPGDLAFRFANDPTCHPFRLDGKDTWTRPTR